ncbi:MAG: restriction endonuclease subunit S, partial [Candidatus Hadarchaeales archaeon]
TEIGRIPKEWEVRRVMDLFTVETGTTPSTKQKEYWEGGTVNWITPTDLSKLNGKIKIKVSERKITEKALKETNLTLVPKGSIVISTRAPVGYVAVLEQEATFNQGCKGLVPKNPDEICSEFYCYFLLHKRQMLENLSSGSTFKELSKEGLEVFRMPFPPFPEQRRIAEILSTVDQAIQRVDEAITRTERLKRGLMQELLTKGIGHREFKDTEIGRIPKEWEVVRLGEICEFKRGFSYRSDQITSLKKGAKFITINDLEKEGGLKREAEEIYVLEEFIEKDFLLEDGDVLIANTDMSQGFIIGAPLLIEKKIDNLWMYSMDLTKLIFDKTMFDSRFFFYILKSNPIRLKMKSFAQGTNVLHLNHELAKLLVIPLPPLPEQRRIAEVLSTVDKKLELERKRREKLERIKRGLMNDLLTGRIRVWR